MPKSLSEKASEKVLEIGVDFLINKLKNPSPPFDGVYPEALHLSLKGVRF
jgi:hypothetical protein